MDINKILSPWYFFTFFLIKAILRKIALYRGKYEKSLIYRYKTCDGLYRREGKLICYSQSLMILISIFLGDIRIFLTTICIILILSLIRSIVYFES